MNTIPSRGLFVTGTGTEVGKTYVTALIARSLVAAGKKVGVYKPAASGCVTNGDGLVSEDARGEASWWRLPATHFRLVTDKNRSYYPTAYLTAFYSSRGYQGGARDYKTYWNSRQQEDWTVHVPEQNEEGNLLLGKLGVARKWWPQGGPAKLTIDWVYRIPRDEKAKRLIFRRVAKADLPKPKAEMPPKEGALERTEVKERPGR